MFEEGFHRKDAEAAKGGRKRISDFRLLILDF
jgi:hypothetical protein